MKNRFLYISLLALVGFFGCEAAGDKINPFAVDSSNGFGEANTNAILGGASGGGAAEKARHALEVAGSYQRALPPQPVYPVIRPAEVRLMWIPDHLTLDGNLVPAHYYHIKIHNDMWELQDAFEIEGQINNRGVGGGDYGTNGGGGAGYGGATPWVYKDGKR